MTVPHPGNEGSTKPGIGSLVFGIIADIRDLFVKEITAARLELKEDLRSMAAAALLLGAGLGVAGIGSLLLAIMLVYLLAAVFPLSLWMAYGLVGIGFLALGLALLYRVKRRAATIDMLPRETTQAAKKDVQWIKSEVISGKK